MNRHRFQAAAITALTALPAPALAQYHDGWPMMPMHRWGMGWLWMLMGIAFWILIVLALAYLVKYLVQITRRGEGPTAAAPGSALDILKERYARGEINREEFQSRKKDLTE
jgi:putative membrane protein